MAHTLLSRASAGPMTPAHIWKMQKTATWTPTAYNRTPNRTTVQPQTTPSPPPATSAWHICRQCCADLALQGDEEAAGRHKQHGREVVWVQLEGRPTQPSSDRKRRQQRPAHGAEGEAGGQQPQRSAAPVILRRDSCQLQAERSGGSVGPIVNGSR